MYQHNFLSFLVATLKEFSETKSNQLSQIKVYIIFMQKQKYFQPLQSYSSSPSLNFISLNKGTALQYCKKSEEPFSKRIRNSNQEAMHSKLNKIKLRDVCFTFENRELSIQNRLNNLNNLQPKIQQDNKIREHETQLQPNLYGQTSVKQSKIQTLKTSFSLPKNSFFQQKQIKGLTRVQSNLLIGGNFKSSNFINAQTPKNNLQFSKKYEFSLNELQQKVKDLENQLQFQQKYSNDLYRSNQKLQLQIKKLKQMHSQQIWQIKKELTNKTLNLSQIIQKQKNQLQKVKQQSKLKDNSIRYLEKMIDQKQQSEQTQNLNINEKQMKIFLLQGVIKQKQNRIQNLQNQINNFNQIYKNQLYQERIRQLSEQKTRQRQINCELTLQKIKLGEQLKMKNQKIKSLNLQYRCQNGDNNFGNNNQHSNYIMTSLIQKSFEENRNSYEKNIQQLKKTIEMNDQIISILKNNIIQKDKQIYSSKEQIKVISVKAQNQRKNFIFDKQRALQENKSQLNSLVSKVKMLEVKCSNLVSQIQEKDTFFKNFVIGRAKNPELKQDIIEMFKIYKQKFIEKYINTTKINISKCEANIIA